MLYPKIRVGQLSYAVLASVEAPPAQFPLAAYVAQTIGKASVRMFTVDTQSPTPSRARPPPLVSLAYDLFQTRVLL